MLNTQVNYKLLRFLVYLMHVSPLNDLNILLMKYNTPVHILFTDSKTLNLYLYFWSHF